MRGNGKERAAEGHALVNIRVMRGRQGYSSPQLVDKPLVLVFTLLHTQKANAILRVTLDSKNFPVFVEKNAGKPPTTDQNPRQNGQPFLPRWRV